MSDITRQVTNLPPEQRRIWQKGFRPKGTFVEFAKEEIEQTIPERFEQQVITYPDRIAVKKRSELVFRRCDIRDRRKTLHSKRWLSWP
jgi:hypothetical protein